MNARKSYQYPIILLFTAAILLLAACQPAATTASPEPTQPPALPTTAPVIIATPVPPTQPARGDIALDYSAVSQNVTVETVPAVPAGENINQTEVLPEYSRLTLQGYPVLSNPRLPQIFVYPAGELASANEAAGKAAADLQALLQTQQIGDQIPFLPLPFSSTQAIHSRVQYLDIKGGKGVRFLTQFNNGLSPVNNTGLLYTFQGLTGDGRFYVAAVFPVASPELPDNSKVDEQLVAAGGYMDYLAKTAAQLDKQPAGSFTPDLDKLDALIQSIEVK